MGDRWQIELLWTVLGRGVKGKPEWAVCDRRAVGDRAVGDIVILEVQARYHWGLGTFGGCSLPHSHPPTEWLSKIGFAKDVRTRRSLNLRTRSNRFRCHNTPRMTIGGIDWLPW